MHICSFVSPPSSLWQTYTTSWLLFSQVVTLLALWVGQWAIARTKMPLKLFILWIELGGKPNQFPFEFFMPWRKVNNPSHLHISYNMNFQKNANLHLTHHMIEIGASGNMCNCSLWLISPGRLQCSQSPFSWRPRTKWARLVCIQRSTRTRPRASSIQCVQKAFQRRGWVFFFFFFLLTKSLNF